VRFSLSTLLGVMTLAAIVAAGFGAHAMWGIAAYVACFSLFMVTWRINAAGKKYDAHRSEIPDPSAPARILWASAGVTFIAAFIFFAGCTYTQISQCPILLAPSNAMFDAQAEFHRALWISIPVGTAAALCFYWLSWPAREK
jgi:hypothetical protein